MVPNWEMIFIEWDLNGYIGKNNGSFERANGGQGYGVRNELRDVIIDFRAT